MVETINQIQITMCSKDKLSVKHGNNSYTYSELMTACRVRVLLNEYYEDLQYEYDITRLTMKII